MHAAGLQPRQIGRGPRRLRAGAAHIGDVRAALDQQTGHQELRAFIAADRHAALDRHARQRALDGRQPLVLGRVDLRLAHVAGLAHALQPGFGAVVAHGGGRHDGPARGLEFAHAGGVEGMDGGHGRAVQRRIELAPLARGHHRSGGQAHGREQHADAHGVGREHLAQQGDGGLVRNAAARRRHRAGLGLATGEPEHGAGQHVLGLGMRGHAKARHVDADDAHAVDVLGQQLQRHAAGRGHAQVDDDHRVVQRRVSLLEDGFADVLEQLARDQALAVERHVAHGAARTVEVGGEGQAVHAAGRT